MSPLNNERKKASALAAITSDSILAFATVITHPSATAAIARIAAMTTTATPIAVAATVATVAVAVTTTTATATETVVMPYSK